MSSEPCQAIQHPGAKMVYGEKGSILSANKGTPYFYKTTAPRGNCPLCPPY